MLRYKLRTLLIVLALVVPLMVAYVWWAITLTKADHKAMREAYERAQAAYEARKEPAK